MATDDVAKQARTQRKEDEDRAYLLSSLLKHPGWAEYERLINSHIGKRTSDLLEPVEPGMRDASEHNKGAVYGMIYVRDLPRVTVMAMEELKKSSPSEDDEEDPAGE